MKTTLDNADYCRAARELGCDPAMVRAVAEVESAGAGFTGSAPTILFERHVFYRCAPKAKRDQWAEDHPDLCHPRPYPKGGYGAKSKQYEKVRRAAELDYDAALKACSWGTFQELGENHLMLGYPTVREFVEAMRSGAPAHLDIFVRSIRSRGLEGAMRKPSPAMCRKIARRYNGPAYAKFEYDTKIWAKYEKYRGKISCPGGEAPAPAESAPAAPPPLPPAVPAEKGIIERIAEADTKLAVVDQAATRVSNASWLVTLSTKIGGWLLLLWSLVTTHPEWSVLAALLIVAAIYYLHKSKERGLRRDLANAGN